MPQPLQIEFADEGDATLVTIRGQLDEHADLSEVAERTGDRVIIDLASLSFVNSLGLRAWVRLLLVLNDRNSDIVLRRCSEAMVHQMNMIVAAKAGARVESFYAPYECSHCGHASTVLVDVAAERKTLATGEIPDKTCPDCGEMMQCDELPERYLLFLELD